MKQQNLFLFIETNMKYLNERKASRAKFPFINIHPLLCYLLYIQGILKMNEILKQLNHNTVFSELLIE